MQKYIYLLIFVFLFFYSPVVISSDDNKEFDAAEIQKHVDDLTNQINESNYASKAVWINSYTIDVTFNPVYLQYMTKEEVENHTHRHAFSFYMLKMEQQPICARSSDKDGNELAYKCYGLDSL